MRRDHLELVAARAVLELTSAEDLVDAAVAGLEEGRDSPTLRVLAGLSEPDTGEARHLFERTLGELNVVMPNRRDAAMQLARAIAGELLDGAIQPDEAARRVWELTLRVPPGDVPELDPFIYAASEWDGRPEDRDLFAAGIVRTARNLLR